MKVLLIGVGGVGEAIAAIARPREWIEQIVLARALRLVFEERVFLSGNRTIIFE